MLYGAGCINPSWPGRAVWNGSSLQRRPGGGDRVGTDNVTVVDHAEVVRLYGPWRTRTPHEAASFLDGYPGRWWIAGGWAIDAFTGTARAHGDLDIGIPREEADGFIAFVGATLDVWAAARSLTPLPRHGATISDDCGNLWLRASGADPWEYDVLLEDVRSENWLYKRAARISRPLSDCLWSHDGITYLRPEVQLLLKARNAQSKDDLDFERCLPKLDEASRCWLARSMDQEEPGHPWRRRLAC